MNRYKPDVKLRFITEELGFESDSEAAQYILDHKGEEFVADRDGDVLFLTGPGSLRLFEGFKSEAFSRVDIKGQI